MGYTYVISDIHGNYDKYKEMLEVIEFSDQDTLYVLGDIVDRGDSSVKLLQDMMYRHNVFPLVGNHEYMALMVLRKLVVDITKDVADTLEFDPNYIKAYSLWMQEGGLKTIEEFKNLNKDEREDLLSYVEDFDLYIELNVEGEDYILVHGGLDNFREDRHLDDYGIEELIFTRMDYNKEYFEDKIIVSGHTPTRLINEDGSDTIFFDNNHIAIDCGCGHGGELGVYCLETGDEFYV